MNSKITLPRLVTLLSSATGRSKRQCEEFLKALFSEVAEALVDREQVKVKGLGTFRVSRVDARKSVNVSTGEEHHIPAHDKIVFVADKDLAAAVNAPFEMFETVELADGVSDEDLERAGADTCAAISSEAVGTDDSRDTAGKDAPSEVGALPEETGLYDSIEYELADEMSDRGPDDCIEDKAEDVSDPDVEDACGLGADSKGDAEGDAEGDTAADDAQSDQTADETAAGGPVVDVVDTVATSPLGPDGDSDTAEVPVRHPRRLIGKGFLMGFACALLMMIAGFYIVYFLISRKIERITTYDTVATANVGPASSSADVAMDDADSGIRSAPTQEEISGSVPATEASDKVVYDTITDTRYLTTMARDHYGNFNLWAYIYKENESFLGHPDRIRPGTRVVVPPLSKYGIDASRPEDVKKGIRLGSEIYARYGKK